MDEHLYWHIITANNLTRDEHTTSVETEKGGNTTDWFVEETRKKCNRSKDNVTRDAFTRSIDAN